MTYTAKAYYMREHGDNPVEIEGVADLRALIDAMLSEPMTNSIVALYVNERPLTDFGVPDHELRLAIDAANKVGGIRYTSGVDVWYAVGRDSQRDEVYYNYMSNVETFPRDSEVDLGVMLAVAEDLLSLGGDRPTGVEWAEWPPELI